MGQTLQNPNNALFVCLYSKRNNSLFSRNNFFGIFFYNSDERQPLTALLKPVRFQNQNNVFVPGGMCNVSSSVFHKKRKRFSYEHGKGKDFRRIFLQMNQSSQICEID